MPQPSTASDPKRPYGGLVPSQPKGTRAYQDAATYNHHLAQHQVYTAQAQSQAANTMRNPYMTQQPAQQTSSYPNQSADAPPPYPQPQTYAPQNNTGHRLTHQSSTGQLNANSSVPQFSTQVTLSSSTHLSPNMPSNSYYPNSRGRANTINQMDAVPPALARLQHMNQDVIAGRNALTPVLNRDDAMREWERRQTGKAAAAQPYPQLEYLQQQAELAAASGITTWGSTSSRYAAPPSKLSHSYHPQTIVVDEDNSRRDAVMSNVRSAARGDNANTAMYGGGAGLITSPAQTYTSSNTTSGNRYAVTYPQQQQSASTSFDSMDRRSDMANLYVPMQPDQFPAYSGSSSSSTARHVAPPPQTVAPSFYGAGVSSTGQPSGQHRNPFSLNDPSQQSMSMSKDGRRQSGMESWPR